MLHKGYLRRVQECGDKCRHFFSFECEDGCHIKPVQNKANAPCNTYIVADIEEGVLEEYTILERRIARSTSNIVDVALVRPYRAEDEITEERIERLNDIAEEIERSYKLYTDKYDVKVTPYLIVDDEQTYSLHGFDFNKPWVKAQIAQQNPDAYEQHTCWGGYGGYTSGISGLAFTGGNKFWVHIGEPYCFNHELGHAAEQFTLEHSTVGMDDYGGDDWQAKFYAPPNANHQNYLGIVDSSIDVNDSQIVFLAPLDCREGALFDGEVRIARIYDSNRLTIISTRKTNKQFEYGVPGFKKDFIYIHQSDPPFRSTYRSERIAVISEGMAYQIPNTNVTVQHTGSQDGIQRAKITYGIDLDSGADFPEWPSRGGVDITDKFSTIWREERYALQGMDLHIRDDQAVGYWYTYDLNANHVFMVFDGTIKNGNYIEGPIYRTQNGERVEEGYGYCRFHDDNNGEFISYTNMHSRDNMQLNRLAGERGGLSGIYDSGNYSGYSVWQDEETGQMVAYQYNSDGSWRVLDGTPQRLIVYRTSARYKETHGGSFTKVGEAIFNGASITLNGEHIPLQKLL